MLIRGDRHRFEDLELWDEMAAADRVHWTRLERSGKIDRSLDSVRRFLSDGLAYVGVSWGKDSICAAHLVRQVDATVPLINLRCTNRNPDCDVVRDAYLGAHPSTYHEVIVDYAGLHARGLPLHELDRETDRIWNRSIRTIGKDTRNVNGRHILGIRADESFGRAIRYFVWSENSPNGCAPLSSWSTADVFAYLCHFRLPVHPAYAMLGNGRWPRDRLRVAEIGDTHGTGSGRLEWEREYYGDVLNRLSASIITPSGNPIPRKEH